MSTLSFASDRFLNLRTTNRHFRRCSPLELLTLSREGDNDARHCLVGRYQGLINALAWRMTSNPSDAEDMISEAYLRVYRVLHSCQNVETLPGWIKRITINVFHHL